MQKWTALELLKLYKFTKTNAKVKQFKISQLFFQSNLLFEYQSHTGNNCQLHLRMNCHLPSNSPHLDNSSTDQLLDLVHHHWILCMFLCSLRIFLEINQYLHTRQTLISTSVLFYAIHTNMQPIKRQTCLITGSWRMFCISGSCIALACKENKI